MTKQQAKTRSDLVSVANGKPKIFILHGWTYSKSKWAPFVSLLKNRGLTPILLNIPGLTEEINRPWTIDDYVNWLYKKLEKDPAMAGQEKIVLIGHSNGGRIAMAFAIKYPDKVSKLILIDSAGIYHNEIFLRIKRSVFKAASKVGKKLITSKKAMDLIYLLAGEKDYKNASPEMKKTVINLIESDKAFKIDRISVPTIIIWGKNDRVTPVSDGKILNEKIVNSKLFIIDDARHSPQFTNPEKVAEIISENL